MQTMRALTYDRVRDPWESSRGLRLTDEPSPELDESRDPGDGDMALVRVRFAGFCGSDRGIWSRQAFGDMILGSLAEEGKDRRIVGHEMLGEVVAIGSRAAAARGIRPGDAVSTESHIVCGECYPCRAGDTHVCARDRIIGISMDGCFAEYIKLPAKALWPTDLSRIRPEVGAVQEPFGNAVHACTQVDLAGRSVAVFGCGTIGLFAVLIARGMGARQVIGVEPDPRHAEMARALGCDAVIRPDLARIGPESWRHDPDVRRQVRELTAGVGADVSMEMSGFPGSVNNAVKSTRRGGHVVLFGIKSGDLVVEDFDRIVLDGLTLHAVVGRRIFGTWEVTRRLLEDPSNGVQDAIWNVILDRGQGTIVPIEGFDPQAFERVIREHPKAVIRFAG